MTDMIDLRYVKKLIEMLDGSTVDSVEMTSDKGTKIRISKSPQHRGHIPMPAQVAVPTLMSASPVLQAALATSAAPALDAQAPARTEPARVQHLEVKSPMVGTYYSQPDPGSKPYVSVGQRIEKGQILCIIEAMKIMNEIESEFSGVVTEVSVSDSQPVEYGQVLMRVDPNG